MPPVIEIACRDEACDVDMFAVHYAPDASETGPDLHHCPGCGGTSDLAPLD